MAPDRAGRAPLPAHRGSGRTIGETADGAGDQAVAEPRRPPGPQEEWHGRGGARGTATPWRATGGRSPGRATRPGSRAGAPTACATRPPVRSAGSSGRKRPGSSSATPSSTRRGCTGRSTRCKAAEAEQDRVGATTAHCLDGALLIKEDCDPGNDATGKAMMPRNRLGQVNGRATSIEAPAVSMRGGSQASHFREVISRLPALGASSRSLVRPVRVGDRPGNRPGSIL